MKEILKRIDLPASEIPSNWYNIQADMPHVPPMHLSAQTLRTATPEELSVIFPQGLLAQEFSTERYIEIPDEVRDMYKSYRATPLYRATELEKLLDTPAKIYYKYEGGNATGSHKLNSAIAQAYYNKREGVARLVTETGAGQWGSALSMACDRFGMECVVYMVKVSYEQKPYRKSLMRLFGGTVYSSPTTNTAVGREILKNHPDTTGSLGIAISECLEETALRADTHYALGSVLNFVCLHQTVIGLEAKKQLELAGDYPDVVIGCCGGGSNFGGVAFPFLYDKLTGKEKNLRAVAVEPTACPTLTKGVYAYDYGDTSKLGPVTKMYTLGHDFVPSGIHAGGLRYHGVSPLISSLYHDGIIEAQAYGQLDALSAGLTFARTEGIVPAPESSHAIKGAIVEALKCRESGEKKTILFNLSGNGYFDMFAYEKLLAGNLTNIDFEEESMREAIESLPKVAE